MGWTARGRAQQESSRVKPSARPGAEALPALWGRALHPAVCSALLGLGAEVTRDWEQKLLSAGGAVLVLDSRWRAGPAAALLVEPCAEEAAGQKLPAEGSRATPSGWLRLRAHSEVASPGLRLPAPREPCTLWSPCSSPCVCGPRSTQKPRGLSGLVVPSAAVSSRGCVLTCHSSIVEVN